MMIKCQKCGFENQMGSIFCRNCSEKLDMDAIDPNKLQKDVEKEKMIKNTKKRVKKLISTCISLLFIAAFLGLIFYNGGLHKFDEPTFSKADESALLKRYDDVVKERIGGKVKFSYKDLTLLLMSKIVLPMSDNVSTFKVKTIDIQFNKEKSQPVAYIWISIKDAVDVLYTVNGDFEFSKKPEWTPKRSDEVEPTYLPIQVDVKRLDIGRLPIFYRSDIFLNSFNVLLDNDPVRDLFKNAQEVEFNEDGVTITLPNKAPAPAPAPAAARRTTSSTTTANPAASTFKSYQYAGDSSAKRTSNKKNRN